MCDTPAPGMFHRHIHRFVKFSITVNVTLIRSAGISPKEAEGTAGAPDAGSGRIPSGPILGNSQDEGIFFILGQIRSFIHPISNMQQSLVCDVVMNETCLPSRWPCDSHSHTHSAGRFHGSS